MGHHPRLAEVLFSHGYWRSGVDIFGHLSLAEYFHGGADMLPTWDVLDLGCGVGRQTFYLATKAKSVTGADISQSLLRLARRYKALKKLGANLQFKVLDGRNLKCFNNDSFDFIYSYNVFQFLRYEQHILDYLRDICRVLRKGGYAQLYLPTRGINIESVDPRGGISLRPESWETLVNASHLTRADVIVKNNEEEQCEWFLIQK